jgi:2-aminoethylphosphonate-pyruvate transaminase
MQAVILAAGMGSRIRDIHALPKGFIAVGDQTIIEESIEKLRHHGIQPILIVTGYSAQHYDVLAKTHQLSTFFNSHYHDYGSLYSLYCAKEWIQDDFLLLESDIFYESRALDKIIQDDNPTGILISGETQSGDEVYVQAQGNKLIKMSKQINTLEVQNIAGEFVGINKIALRDFQYLINKLESNPMVLQSGHYEEDGLVMLAKDRDIACVKIPDLLWGEIDNNAQLQRAKKIYEQIELENHQNPSVSERAVVATSSR